MVVTFIIANIVPVSVVMVIVVIVSNISRPNIHDLQWRVRTPFQGAHWVVGWKFLFLGDVGVVGVI